MVKLRTKVLFFLNVLGRKKKKKQLLWTPMGQLLIWMRGKIYAVYVSYFLFSLKRC